MYPFLSFRRCFLLLQHRLGRGTPIKTRGCRATNAPKESPNAYLCLVFTSQASHGRSAPPPGTPTAPACYVSFFQVSQALPATSAPPGARYTYHTQGAEPSERVSVRPPCTCDSYYLTGKQGAVYVVPSPPQVPTRAMYPFFKFRSGLGKDPQQKSSKKP